MSAPTITEDEEGKRVVTEHGDDIGVIAEVRGGTAHVDPDPSVMDSIKAKLGWGDTEGTHALDPDHVMDVTEDEVRLREM
jgi:hypothetical protein